MRLVTAAEMRELDRHTIEDLGVPGQVLMARAGRAVAEAAIEVAESSADGFPRRFLALAGVGNNGGDAYVAARVLQSWGWRGRILEFADPERIRGDAAHHRRLALLAGVPSVRCETEALLEEALRDPGIVIDGLLGTGLRGEVRDPFRGAISQVNRSRAPVVAVDIPSGLDADSGLPLPEAVRARVTVTMALPKFGLVRGRGLDHAGRILVADIGIPRSRPGSPSPSEAVRWIDRSGIAGGDLLRRARTAHKGTCGHVLVVAGSVGFAGAAVLCAEGALRGGSGLVSVAVPEPIYVAAASSLREAMVHPAPASDGGFAGDAAETVLALAERATVLAVGPGIGRGDGAASLVRTLLGRVSRPIVLDADGLNVLGSPPEAIGKRRAPTVVTPHPGEMARLVRGYEWAAEWDPGDRDGAWEIARRFAEATGAVTVLKGAGTLVADPADGSLSVNGSGNPGMATGGTGDCLTGLLAAFLAGGHSPAAAARAAVWIHGAAADRAALRTGETALLPRDLLAEIPSVLRDLES